MNELSFRMSIGRREFREKMRKGSVKSARIVNRRTLKIIDAYRECLEEVMKHLTENEKRDYPGREISDRIRICRVISHTYRLIDRGLEIYTQNSGKEETQ